MSWLELPACAVVVRSCTSAPRAWSGAVAPAAAVVGSVASRRGGRSVAASVASVRSAGAVVDRSASMAGRLPVGRRKTGRGSVEEGGRGRRAAPSADASGCLLYTSPSPRD
eukprot:14064003-Alexandrium_andersonii.AAC.1